MRKAWEAEKESEELAASVLLSEWRPVAGYCVRRDEDVERQHAGFKAPQLLLCPIFSTTLRFISLIYSRTYCRLNHTSFESVFEPSVNS